MTYDTLAVNIIFVWILMSISNATIFPARGAFAHGGLIRVFAIYQIMLGWKTCKYYHETNELPNPRPTQPKKK